MTEANESADITVEEEVVAAPEMSTVERAEMLLNQDEAIFKRVQEGASLDEAVDPSNKEFSRSRTRSRCRPVWPSVR